MKFHGIQMVGSFQLEKVTSLPSWTPADESRMIYNTTEKKLYIGTSDSWSEAGGGGGYGLPVTNFSDNGILDSGKMYFIDTSTGSMSGNLIPNPLIGDTVTIVDTTGTFDSYSFTVKGNGNNIQHDINLELDVKDVIIILVWTGTSWKIDVGGVVTGSGGGNTFTTEYNTSFTASAGMVSFVDTRANEVTVTLPDENTLSTGTQITIFDQYSTFSTNKVTVLSTQAVFENGTNIIYLTNDGSRTTFTWDSGTGIWRTETASNVSGLGNVFNIDSDYDANVGDFLFIDTTSGTVNITLPPSGQLTSQSVISIYDQMDNFSNAPVNVTPSYGTIKNSASYSATDSGTRIDFIWDKENTDWKIDIGGDISNVLSNTSSGGMGGSNPVTPTGNFTAQNGDFYFIDTSSNTVYITMPDANSLSTGAAFSIYDLKGTFSTHNVVVNAVNSTVLGDPSFTADIDNIKVDFFYDNDINEWKVDIGGVLISSGSGNGSGGGGMGGWNPVTHTSDFTAQKGDFSFIDTSSNTVTVTMPDANTSNTGDAFTIYDLKGTFADNNATVNAVNSTIVGDSSFIADINDLKVDFFYDSDINEWKVDIGGKPVSVNGGSGSGTIAWTFETADFYCEKDNKYMVDTSNQPLIATLPATPTNGDTIKFADGGDFSVNSLTILRNGNTIEGLAEDMTVDTKDISFELIFYNNDWKIYIDGIPANTSTSLAWTFETNNFNCEKDNKYMVDTTSGALIATLPATPTNGDTIKFADGGDFSVNSLTVARNGNTIEGLSEDMTVNTENMSFELVYYNNDWKLA